MAVDVGPARSGSERAGRGTGDMAATAPPGLDPAGALVGALGFMEQHEIAPGKTIYALYGHFDRRAVWLQQSLHAIALVAAVSGFVAFVLATHRFRSSVENIAHSAAGAHGGGR